MNAHTPFDANQDWTNPYCQNSSNDPMVDALLGNAYHVVRTVYCNLGNLKLIYDFLNQYGMVLGVQSEAELKALTTKASFARIYDKTPAGDRQVTDYLYVEGDRTGILPDDTTATGSWVKVATSGTGGGGGESSNDGGYIPWIYNSGSAIGGETTIRIPDETAGVPFMIVNGDWQTEGYDFEYDPVAFEVSFTTPLEPGDFVVVMRTGVPATPDNPNVSDWVTINWLYNQGAAVGGEQVIDIPYTFQSVPAVYKNGLRFHKELTNNSYTIDSDNNRIILTEPLATNDRLIVQLGGEAKVLEVVDHTIQEVARSANVKDSEVILSTDTSQVLNGKTVVYSVSEQKAYRLPTLPSNVYIQSVDNSKLVYNPGGVMVDLLPLDVAETALINHIAELTSETGASTVGTSTGATVEDVVSSVASDISLYGYVYGSGLDAKDSILAAIANTGSAHLSGDITVSTFDWPQGAKLTGKSTITYTRRPSLPCVLDSYTPVNKTLQKGTYVFGDYDIWDMLQLKTAGFNIIMHYGYAFHDSGNFEKLCNAAEAVGIDVIINSPNDTPLVSDIALGQRDVVKGFYIFDEPQHQGVSVSSQNARLSAWRNATSKAIVISDNGVWGFQNDTIADGYDIILVDSYYIASATDSDNKMFAVVCWEELSYKSKHAKLIPTVGLFTGDDLSNKEKQISFAKKFFAMGDGSYFCFAWDSSTADPAQNDIISDQDFYDAAKTLNGIWVNTPYHNEVYLFGSGVGLNGALLAYDQRYSSTDVKPFAVVNAGSAIDERRQTFSDSGFAFRNNGGTLALQIKNKGYLIVSMAYRNYADGSAPTTFTVFTTPDDFYSSSDVYSVTLNPNSGKTSGIEMNKKSSIGLRITPSASNAYFHKFISGYFITSTWNGSNF